MDVRNGLTDLDQKPLAGGKNQYKTVVVDETVPQGLLQYDTYNDYLDSLVTEEDIWYLQSYEAARSIAELGYRCTGETLSETKFYKIKAQLWEEIHPRKRPYDLASEDYFRPEKKKPSKSKWAALRREGRPSEEESATIVKFRMKESALLRSDPLLYELAERERANRTGVLATIIFIRDFNKFGHEVSGYIDYGDRLLSEPWEPFFAGEKRIMPRTSDLTFYHWKYGKATWKSSRNYRVILDPNRGLIFQHRYDRKTMSPDPKLDSPGCNTIRVTVSGSHFAQVALYDHIVRKKL